MTNKEAAYILSDNCCDYSTEELRTAFDLAIKALEERPTGHWIEDIHEDYTPNHDTWECSNCGEPYMLMEGTPENNKYNYCPNCGVKIKRGTDNG